VQKDSTPPKNQSQVVAFDYFYPYSILSDIGKNAHSMAVTQYDVWLGCVLGLARPVFMLLAWAAHP